MALVNNNDFGVGTVLLDANGSFVSGCPAGVTSASITQDNDVERATRFWLVRFGRPLASYRLN